MNKLTTAALAGLVAVTATAGASVSRWDGFGSIGAAFIADVQGIWTLPGAIVNYKDALYAELGGGSYSNNVWGGAHFELGNGVLGVWGNRPVSEGGNLNQSVPGWGTPGNNPNESIDIIYGFNLSEDTTIAAGINRAQWSEIDKTKEPATDDYYDEEIAGTLGLSLGLEQKNVGPIALLEVGLQFNTITQSYLYKETLPGTDEDKASINGTDIDLRIGGDMTGDDGRFSRVELGLNMDSASAKYEPMPVPVAGSHVETKYNGFGYNVGYAAGKSGEKGMGLVGLMLTSRSDVSEEVNGNGANYNYKRAYSLFQLTAGLAAEGKVNSWLTFRGGLTTNVLHNTSRERTRGTAAGDETHTNSTTDYNDWYDLYGGQNGTASFGTSMTFGNLTIDGVLDQDLLWDGPYLVTGSSAGGLSTNVSATWVY